MSASGWMSFGRKAGGERKGSSMLMRPLEDGLPECKLLMHYVEGGERGAW